MSAAAAAKSRQSCPTLCDPIDGSPPGSSFHGIFQARVLEWGAIAFSADVSRKVKVKSFSRIWLLATPWTAAYKAPPSMGFSKQEYWSGVPLPSLQRTDSLEKTLMLWKCCTEYASKFGKLSSGLNTGEVSFHSNSKERQCQRMFKLLHICAHFTW